MYKNASAANQHAARSFTLKLKSVNDTADLSENDKLVFLKQRLKQLHDLATAKDYTQMDKKSLGREIQRLSEEMRKIRGVTRKTLGNLDQWFTAVAKKELTPHLFAKIMVAAEKAFTEHDGNIFAYEHPEQLKSE